MSKSGFGVYFSANDAVLEWTYAFLNSFRESNPSLPLFLIPFSSDCKAILRLRREYDFEVYADPSFAELERIGEEYELGHTPHGRFWFRRFASFWGPLEQFMYLDARQVVLTDLRPFIQAPRPYGFDLLHFDCAIEQVYQPSPFRTELLRQGGARGFNSGRWASRRGVFTLEELRKLADQSLRIRDQLNPRNTDQAFLNYCCDTKPIRYGRFSDVMGDICPDGWARQPGQIYRQNGRHYLWDHGGLSHRRRVVLIHWAGIGNQPTMPRRRLFLKYRDRRAPWLQKAKAKLIDSVRWPFYWCADHLRDNRWINQTYHRYIAHALKHRRRRSGFCGADSRVQAVSSGNENDGSYRTYRKCA